MLSVFVPTASSLKKIDGLSADALPADAIWIDLKSPVPGEDKAVEEAASPAAALEAVFMTHIDFVSDHPGVPRMLFGEVWRPRYTPHKRMT